MTPPSSQTDSALPSRWSDFRRAARAFGATLFARMFGRAGRIDRADPLLAQSGGGRGDGPPDLDENLCEGYLRQGKELRSCFLATKLSSQKTPDSSHRDIFGFSRSSRVPVPVDN